MDLRRVFVVAIAVLLATPMYGQDRVFDTEVTADTNLLKYLPGGSQEVFMRKRGPFRLGWNWNGPYSNAIDTLLEIQLNHHHVYGPGDTVHHSDSDMIHNAENGGSIHEQSCMLTHVVHLDLSNVPSGIYTLQVGTPTGRTIANQVIVIH